MRKGIEYTLAALTLVIIPWALCFYIYAEAQTRMADCLVRS